MVGVTMALSERVKVGLVFSALSVVFIGISVGMNLSAQDEYESDNVDCSGWNPLMPIISISDVECESEDGSDDRLDYGICSCCVGLCMSFIAAWTMLSALVGLIFGKKSESEVNFVAPPSEPPEIEDEFADLEAELDAFE